MKGINVGRIIIFLPDKPDSRNDATNVQLSCEGIYVCSETLYNCYYNYRRRCHLCGAAQENERRESYGEFFIEQGR